MIIFVSLQIIINLNEIFKICATRENTHIRVGAALKFSGVNATTIRCSCFYFRFINPFVRIIQYTGQTRSARELNVDFGILFLELESIA